MIDDVVIVGAGPSGLAAAHETTQHGARTTVVERLACVGGLARTIEFEGSRFDIGPHRFFTRNQEVYRLFAGVVGEDLIRVSRKTRIMQDRKFFDYPLTPVNAMLSMGFGDGCAAVSSYVNARISAALAPRPIENFEDWTIDRFGRRLYQRFFKGYTEKIWGISCREIRPIGLRNAFAD
jgi:protoporphyrinogen oxidase